MNGGNPTSGVDANEMPLYPVGTQPLQPIIVAFSKSVLYFCHHQRRLTPTPLITVKNRNGIEAIARIAQIRQQIDWSFRQQKSVRRRIRSQAFTQS